MRRKAKDPGEDAAMKLVDQGIIAPQAWPMIARLVSEVIEQDRDSVPRDEEDTLP
jgi:hypothetical protein